MFNINKVSDSENIAGVGESDLFQKLINDAKKLAKIPRPILIRGERGTGKELLARFIHKVSPQKNHPYIIINCAAFQKDLFEAEMFGYSKGAYTGATESKPGKLEIADKGTLFLDEVANMIRENSYQAVFKDWGTA